MLISGFLSKYMTSDFMKEKKMEIKRIFSFIVVCSILKDTGLYLGMGLRYSMCELDLFNLSSWSCNPSSYVKGFLLPSSFCTDRLIFNYFYLLSLFLLFSLLVI